MMCPSPWRGRARLRHCHHDAARPPRWLRGTAWIAVQQGHAVARLHDWRVEEARPMSWWAEWDNFLPRPLSRVNAAAARWVHCGVQRAMAVPHRPSLVAAAVTQISGVSPAQVERVVQGQAGQTCAADARERETLSAVLQLEGLQRQLSHLHQHPHKADKAHHRQRRVACQLLPEAP